MSHDPHSASQPPEGYRPSRAPGHGDEADQHGAPAADAAPAYSAAPGTSGGQAGSGQYPYSAPGQHQPSGPEEFSATAQGHQPGTEHPMASNWAVPPKPVKQRGRMGAGSVVAVALVAGLVGGGAGAVGYATLSDSTDSGTAETPTQGDIQVNSPDEATTVTAAASEASPSVVTLGVTGESAQGSGSGIILDDEGHVLTNTHVVTLGGATGDPTIQVRLNDGRVTSAELVGTDPTSDLAVIQLEDTEDLVPAEMGSSSDLNVGDRAIAIGAPLGLSGTVTDGIISTLDRTISVQSSAAPEDTEIEDDPQQQEGESEGEGFEFFFPNQEESGSHGSIFLNVIQTDASINQGNSGGALVDEQGRVIGVNVAIASTGSEDPFGGEDSGGSIGVGFSIPIDYAQRVAEEIIENGEATHGLLGVTVTAASPDDEANERLLSGDVQGSLDSFTAGALVNEVPDATPAAEAGIERGDVITHVEDRPIEDSSALTATVREYGSGDTITLTIRRGESTEDVEVTLTGM